MKRPRLLPLALLPALLLAACGAGDSTAPTVSLSVSPTTLTYPGDVTLTATATDASSGVSRVEFYQGSTLIATDSTAPYTATASVTAAQSGTVTFRARAVDTYGNAAEATASLTAAITDANEPNDSVANATTLAIGGTATGTIAGIDRDYDYFKFDAAEGDQLRLTVRSTSVNAASTLDPQVTILLPDGVTVFERDDDSGTDQEADIRFNVTQAGTYTAVVTSFDIYDDETATDDLATNTYQIALTRR